ncbi:MAG TPA: KH domain-containing protein, partial [Verrucomicrobiota bacterium]|nr:KH domain-containing protein [Verrucomicrobiota bacterium]
MQAFLEQVVKGLVDYPDAVNITEVEQERTTIYELRLDPTDVGRIIG